MLLQNAAALDDTAATDLLLSALGRCRALTADEAASACRISPARALTLLRGLRADERVGCHRGSYHLLVAKTA